MTEQKESLVKSSFFIRTCSGIVLVLLALFFILTGGNILLLGLGTVSLVGLFELYRVMEIHDKLLGYTGYAISIAYYIHLHFAAEDRAQLVFLFILALVLLLAVYVIWFPAYRCEQVMAAFFGIFYVPVMLSYIYQCRVVDGGIFLVWLIFISSWGCDTCAYLAGITMGKHKMAPVLSPKKSVEGAVGGVAGAIILGFLFGTVFRMQIPLENPPFVCAAVCGIGSLISMIGDLAASAIKRDHEVKDYGTLIPGHGGILDRFDSVIFTAPVIYYTIMYFM
ncbi:MAG: phosphatidate cytidylyltransferase [Lachnospiraceae bacterium]|nr:phosphatidate cytidylyltransferase [Lachnospiraceae bacterium]